MNLSFLLILSYSYVTDCPLDCTPGQCIRTNSAQLPYACLCDGTVQLNNCARS